MHKCFVGLAYMILVYPNYYYEIHQMFFIPPSFYVTYIIIPFLNSSISANHDKVDGLTANGEILVKGLFLSFLYCRFSFNFHLSFQWWYTMKKYFYHLHNELNIRWKKIFPNHRKNTKSIKLFVIMGNIDFWLRLGVANAINDY